MSDPQNPGREGDGAEEFLDPASADSASAHPLRLHREHHGWSQGDVAEQLVELGYEHGVNLGVIGATVGRWERGVCKPRPPYPRFLCLPFGTTAEDLGLSPSLGRCRSGRLEDEMERRRLLRMLAAAAVAPVLVQGKAGAAAAASADVGRLAGVLRKPSRFGETAVSVIESCILDARRLDDALGSRVAVETALPLRKLIRTMLREGPSGGPARRRLTVAAGDLSQFLAHLAFEMNDHPTGLRYLGETLTIAHETDAHSLGAYALGWRGKFEVGGGRPREAMAYIESARSWADAKGSSATRAWLAREEADALAQLGDRSGAEGALERAQNALARSRAGDEPPWMYWFSSVDYKIGSVYVTLGLPGPARRSLEQRLATWDSSFVRDQAYVLTQLGTTYRLDKEIDEACRFGSQALAIATSTSSDRLVARVRKLRAQLEPWKNQPSVRSLDEQIAATSAWSHPLPV